MKIPVGIFFGGRTPARDQSLQTARRVFRQLEQEGFIPLAFFVDPFGQLIFLEEGVPAADSTSEFYPSEKYFSATERAQFAVYPEQLGELGIAEQLAMARQTGKLMGVSDLPENISIAFLALPDVQELQQSLHVLRIPHTGEAAELFELCSDRYALRMQLQQLEFELPPALVLTAREWREKDDLQAIWGEDSASVAYPLLVRPARQLLSGRSNVIMAKDGPVGLRRAIDQAFGHKRLSTEDWLDMSPVDRENFVRRLAQWSSGLGFPLELHTGKDSMLFQRPQSLLDFLNHTEFRNTRQTLLFRSVHAQNEILVSSLPEGVAFSCVLIRREDDSWHTANLHFMGSAQEMAAGTDAFPVQAGKSVKVSDSLKEQLITACGQLADGLGVETGIRIIGLLSANGRLIPEEIQPFLGPNAAEETDTAILQGFILASLEATQARKPDPTYRSLIEAVNDAGISSPKEQPHGEGTSAMKATEDLPPAAPPQEPVRATPPSPAPAPKPRTQAPETVHSSSQVIYERELQRLKREQQIVPEATAQKRPEPDDRRKKLAMYWTNTKLFFRSRVFWRNAGAIALFLGILFLLVNMTLRMYTRHGDSMQLEDYQGLLLEDAERKAAARGLKMEVISTSFQPGKRPNEIFAQYPEPLSKVKENRTVFVSVYQNEGREITLPALTEIGDDIETYRRELKKRKIDVRISSQVFEPKYGEGTILYLIVNGEKITNTQLRQGDVKVEQGKIVEAVVTTRVSKTVDMPDLVCKTYEQASFHLTGVSLVVGKVYGAASGDRANLYVWKQEPEYAPGKQIDKGAQINLYLTATKPEECE